jgi:hypothetical protein
MNGRHSWYYMRMYYSASETKVGAETRLRWDGGRYTFKAPERALRRVGHLSSLPIL